MNLWAVFFTGLTTGGLSCLAMQGGLLASLVANQKEQSSETSSGKSLPSRTALREPLTQHDWLPVGMFLLVKLLAHVLLGFGLGLLGSALTLSLTVRLAFQTFTALYMFATAMNILQVHPIFRYVVLQPPKLLQRWAKTTSKSRALFAPAVLGMLTIFIPCGVTQAMEVVAINSGDPVVGALTMGAFVLGTSPLFAVIGVATAQLSERWQQTFAKLAAYTLLAMAVYSLNGVLVVANSPLSLTKLVAPVSYFFSQERFSSTTAPTQQGVQKITIGVFNTGYSPNYIKVRRNQPVELTLTSKETYSCAVAFVFKEFGITTFLDPTDSQTFTFTPTKKGKYTFACSMGMYTGTLEVL